MHSTTCVHPAGPLPLLPVPVTGCRAGSSNVLAVLAPRPRALGAAPMANWCYPARRFFGEHRLHCGGTGKRPRIQQPRNPFGSHGRYSFGYYPRGYLQTNVVTVVAASEAVKVPPVTVTAVPAVRLSLDDVTFGVHAAGAVPPAMVIGTLTADVPLLMATDDGAVRTREGREKEIRVGVPRNAHHDVAWPYELAVVTKRVVALGVAPCRTKPSLSVLLRLVPPPEPGRSLADHERRVNPARDRNAIADVARRPLFRPVMHAGHLGLTNLLASLATVDIGRPRFRPLRVVLMRPYNVERGPRCRVLIQVVAIVVSVPLTPFTGATGCGRTCSRNSRSSAGLSCSDGWQQ